MDGLLRYFREHPPPPLGRWCLPTSQVYSSICNQGQKGMFADSDNSVWNAPPLQPHAALPGEEGSGLEREREGPFGRSGVTE